MRRATPTVTPTSTKKRTIGRSSLIESKTNIRSTLKAATVPPGTSASGSGSLPPSTPVPTITHSSSSLSNNLDIEIFNLGEKIYLHGLKKWGVVRYFGDALFSDGKWVGVELFEELGRNDGTVQGHRYFSCKPKYGVFVRPANCSRATNIPASKPIAATPNVRTTSRLTTRASLPNTTVSRSSTMEMKMTSGSEYDSVATRQPTDYKRSSSDLPSDDVLSDEFLTRIASRLLADEKFRSKLIPTSSSPAYESAIDVSSRITRLENSLLEISQRLTDIQDLISKNPRPKRSLSTSVSWEEVQISSTDELDSLKSALAMVASLAKQAHEATLVERLQHAEKIKELEEKIQTLKVEEKEEFKGNREEKLNSSSSFEIPQRYHTSIRIKSGTEFRQLDSGMSETNYYPGCHLPSAGRRKPHQICEHLREMLETRGLCDNLHKELERKEHRNDALMRELQQIRQLHKETQAELRTLKSTFDKISHERKTISTELADSKEYCYKLEIQISRMEHSNQLLLEAEQLKSEIHQYQQLLEQKQIDVDILQQKYQQCEHEKSNLVHSLEACLQYQHHHTGGNNVKGRASYSHEGITQMTSSSSFPPSTPLSSEKMRNIYHELGKRQSDIHALSLALAQVTTERNQLSEENNSLKGNLRLQEEEILKMKQEQERMMEMSLKDADNRAEMDKKMKIFQDENEKFQQEIEDLVRQLSEIRQEYQTYRDEKEAEVDVLSEEIIKLQHDQKLSQERIESLILSIRHRENVHSLTEKKLQTETLKLLKEREVLHSTLNNDETLVKELEILRNNLNQSLKSNEQLAKEKRELLEKFQFDLNENQFLNEKNERKIQILLNENHKLKEEMDDIIREREEAANALRKSIQMTRNLTSKLNFEKERNQELEEKLRAEQHKLAMIIKAKEQVSNAMLDALHREKAIQSSITKSYPYEGGNGLIPSSYSGYVDRSPRYAGGVGGGAILSPSTGNHESPSKTPSARSPLEEKYASIPLSRPPSLHESPPGVVPNESNPPIHRSTIILPDSVEQFATVNATSQPDRDSSPRPSHDYFLNQLLSPSTPAPSVPPLPIPPSNPRVRDTLIDDLKRLKQEVNALDQQTRLPSRYSSQDRHRKHDDDSSTDPGHAMDDLSTSPSDDHDHHNKEKQDDVTTLSLPSEISFTITPRGEDMSSYIEPQQDSPPHGRDTYRSRYLPPSLAHVTSNTQTATLLVEQKAALPSSHDLPSSSTATNAPNGRENGHNSSSTSHSLFDIVNMDFNSPEPSSSHHQG